MEEKYQFIQRTISLLLSTNVPQLMVKVLKLDLHSFNDL